MDTEGSTQPIAKRILLKLSGEAFQNPETGEALDPDVLQFASPSRSRASRRPGGGDRHRGGRRQHLPRRLRGKSGIDRTTGDHMGMLATVINSLALQAGLERAGVRHPGDDRHRHARPSPSRSSGAAPSATSRRGASSSSAPGTGNPYFTTDSAAALRASEIDGDAAAQGHQGGRHLRPRTR